MEDAEGDFDGMGDDEGADWIDGEDGDEGGEYAAEDDADGSGAERGERGINKSFGVWI